MKLTIERKCLNDSLRNKFKWDVKTRMFKNCRLATSTSMRNHTNSVNMQSAETNKTEEKISRSKHASAMRINLNYHIENLHSANQSSARNTQTLTRCVRFLGVTEKSYGRQPCNSAGYFDLIFMKH